MRVFVRLGSWGECQATLHAEEETTTVADVLDALMEAKQTCLARVRVCEGVGEGMVGGRGGVWCDWGRTEGAQEECVLLRHGVVLEEVVKVGEICNVRGGLWVTLESRGVAGVALRWSGASRSETRRIRHVHPMGPMVVEGSVEGGVWSGGSMEERVAAARELARKTSVRGPLEQLLQGRYSVFVRAAGGAGWRGVASFRASDLAIERVAHPDLFAADGPEDAAERGAAALERVLEREGEHGGEEWGEEEVWGRVGGGEQVWLRCEEAVDGEGWSLREATLAKRAC
jgi:hypothetical protein